MMTALCLNPCIDRTVEIPAFAYGGMNRIQSDREDGSGKGVNVAIACRQLGMEAGCVGILAKERSAMITGRLEQSGCSHRFVEIPGAVRVNLKVFNRTDEVVTEINEPGVPVTASQVDELEAVVLDWAGRSDFLVLTGSQPPGAEAGLYARLIAAVGASGAACRCVLDTEGEKLRLGIAARPFMIKPNQFELELLADRELPTVEDIHRAALAQCALGVGLVAVSMGGDGAYVTDGRQAYCSPALDVPVRSTVGAGDSMVAGYLWALSRGLPLKDCFIHAVAAASSSVTTTGTGLIDTEVYRDLLPRVQPRRML